MKVLFVAVGLLISASLALADGSTVFCYWGTWAIYRPGVGTYGVSDLPYDKCTHIVYSFYGLDNTGALTRDPDTTANGKTNSISEFIKLKEKNSNLKLIFGVGGWNEGNDDFSAVSNNDTLRATFVANLLNETRFWGFDGVDIDWEYPTSTADKSAFTWLLRDLQAALQPYNYELSCAVGVTDSRIETSYNVQDFVTYVDHIILMTYDYHGSWDSTTGVVAPLYQQETDTDTTNLNVDYSVKLWISKGAPASKLLLGLAFYGRAFTLTNTSNTGTNAPVTGAGVAGTYSAEAGFLAYYEICLAQSENKWAITEVDDSYVYASYELQWVGYENANTIKAKGAYAKSSGLAGVSVWATDYDDFSALCSSVKYPLLEAAVNGYSGDNNRSSDSSSDDDDSDNDDDDDSDDDDDDDSDDDDDDDSDDDDDDDSDDDDSDDSDDSDDDD